MSALWSVHFAEVSLLDRLRCKSFFKNPSGTNQTVRLVEVSTSEDVRLREVRL